MAKWSRKVGDEFQPLSTKLQRPDGTAADLTGLANTDIQIVVTKDEEGAVPIIDEDITTLVDIPTAEVKWQPADTDLEIAAGTYNVEWRVVRSAGLPEVFPNAGFDTLELHPTNA